MKPCKCPNCEQYVIIYEDCPGVSCDFCGYKEIKDEEGYKVTNPGLEREQFVAKLREKKRDENAKWLEQKGECQCCGSMHNNSDLVSASPCKKPDCTCVWCEQKYRRYIHLRRQRDETKPQRLLFCKGCYETFGHVCRICGSKFPSNTRLNQHLYLMKH